MNASVSVQATATGYTASGTMGATLYTSAAMTTGVTTELASAATVYLKFSNEVSKVVFPLLPVDVDVEFFVSDTKSAGKVLGFPAGSSPEWPVNCNVVKITTKAALGSGTLQVWGAR